MIRATLISSPFLRRALACGLGLLQAHIALAGPLMESTVWEQRRRNSSTPQAAPQLAALMNQPFLSRPPVSKPALIQPDILANHGAVQEIRARASAETRATVQDVVILQDIHLHAEAQKNTAALLQRLVDLRKIDALTVEGAAGRFDFEPYRKMAARDVALDIGDYLLEEGRLGAVSYVGLTTENEIPVIGVDDKTLYRQNVAAYRNSLREKPAALARLAEAEKELALRLNRDAGQDLRQLHQRFAEHEKGALSYGDYLAALKSFHATAPAAVDRFLTAYRLEKNLDLPRVERDRAALFAKLAPLLSQAEIERLTAENVAFREGRLTYGAFYRGLEKLIQTHGLPLDAYPAFRDYIRYVAVSDAIDATALLAEAGRYEEKTLLSAAHTPAEQTWVHDLLRHRLEKKLVEFELTPDEWERYQKVGKGQFETFARFYELADQRSHALVDNLLRVPGKRAALVVGGFHAPHIKQLLREKNIAYTLASPKITKIDSDDASYLSAFTQEKPVLEKLFRGEKLTILPQSQLLAMPGLPNPGVQALLGSVETVVQTAAPFTQFISDNANGITTTPNVAAKGELVEPLIPLPRASKRAHAPNQPAPPAQVRVVRAQPGALDRLASRVRTLNPWRRAPATTQRRKPARRSALEKLEDRELHHGSPVSEVAEVSSISPGKSAVSIPSLNDSDSHNNTPSYSLNPYSIIQTITTASGFMEIELSKSRYGRAINPALLDGVGSVTVGIVPSVSTSEPENSPYHVSRHENLYVESLNANQFVVLGFFWMEGGVEEAENDTAFTLAPAAINNEFAGRQVYLGHTEPISGQQLRENNLLGEVNIAGLFANEDPRQVIGADYEQGRLIVTARFLQENADGSVEEIAPPKLGEAIVVHLNGPSSTVVPVDPQGALNSLPLIPTNNLRQVIATRVPDWAHSVTVHAATLSPDNMVRVQEVRDGKLLRRSEIVPGRGYMNGYRFNISPEADSISVEVYSASSGGVLSFAPANGMATFSREEVTNNVAMIPFGGQSQNPNTNNPGGDKPDSVNNTPVFGAGANNAATAAGRPAASASYFKTAFTDTFLAAKDPGFELLWRARQGVATTAELAKQALPRDLRAQEAARDAEEQKNQTGKHFPRLLPRGNLKVQKPELRWQPLSALRYMARGVLRQQIEWFQRIVGDNNKEGEFIALDLNDTNFIGSGDTIVFALKNLSGPEARVQFAFLGPDGMYYSEPLTIKDYKYPRFVIPEGAQHVWVRVIDPGQKTAATEVSGARVSANAQRPANILHHASPEQTSPIKPVPKLAPSDAKAAPAGEKAAPQSQASVSAAIAVGAIVGGADIATQRNRLMESIRFVGWLIGNALRFVASIIRAPLDLVGKMLTALFTAASPAENSGATPAVSPAQRALAETAYEGVRGVGEFGRVQRARNNQQPLNLLYAPRGRTLNAIVTEVWEYVHLMEKNGPVNISVLLPNDRADWQKALEEKFAIMGKNDRFRALRSTQYADANAFKKSVNEVHQGQIFIDVREGGALSLQFFTMIQNLALTDPSFEGRLKLAIVAKGLLQAAFTYQVESFQSAKPEQLYQLYASQA